MDLTDQRFGRLLETESTEEVNWHDHFYYDETSRSGLRWKTDRLGGAGYAVKIMKAGDQAGSVAFHQDGRKMTFQVRCCGKNRKVHRIIWEMFNGKIPSGFLIDHLDGDPFNNNISNLAMKTKRGNQQNQKIRSDNTTGVKGVSWVKRKDSQYKYAEARVYTRGGEITKLFSTRYLTECEALAAAKEWREMELLKMNIAGECYTDRHIHGK